MGDVLGPDIHLDDQLTAVRQQFKAFAQSFRQCFNALDFEWTDYFDPHLALLAQPGIGTRAALLLTEQIANPNGHRRTAARSFPDLA